MYDAFMADVPYESWAAYLNDVLSQKVEKGGIVLDLACGTGNITLKLAKMGYDMIGVDMSEDMLAEANRKAYEDGLSILFLAQDMQELDLYGTIDAAVCVCDGLNYILNEEGLAKVFNRVKLFMNPGGIFIFDMNTEYKFKKTYADRSFEANTADGAWYTWDNLYDEDKKINEYSMTFFESEDDDEPFIETHYQKAYDTQAICKMILDTGFSSVKIFDDYTKGDVHENTARVVFVAET